ncbi:MAG: carboxypeptidase-like regulatory domain-containing protein [Polyangiales bacterium]
MVSWLALLRSLVRLLAACGVLLAGRVRAEPMVRVRGESRIELGVAHADVGVSITGALRDELGAPLSGRLLALEAVPVDDPGDPWRTQVTTDPDGRFSLEIADPEHDYRLLATFTGDETHRGVRVERRVERARSDVRLELRLPLGHTIDLDAPELIVEAVAESDVGGNEVSMRVWDEAGRELGSGTTDRGGHLRVRVPTSKMGPPGAGLVRIESLRDQRRAEAQTEARIVRKRAVFLRLSAESPEIEAGQPARVRGRAFTHGGERGEQPRASIPVGLFRDDRHLATVMTDAQGMFASELWVDLDQGPLEITARSEGDATGAYPAAEARVSLRIAPARPVPISWLLLAAVAIATAVITAQRLRAPALDAPPEPRREPTEPSISPARARGRRDRSIVSGRVIDLRGDRGLAHARVTVLHIQPESVCTLQSDEDGRFESPPLPSGRARLRVQADGYVGTEIELELPHRGEWSAVVIRLESLRARALAAFRTLISRALPTPRAWGIWTTREARDWMAERAPEQRDALRKLSGEVERACYAAEPPAPAEVTSIEQGASTLGADLRTRSVAERAQSATKATSSGPPSREGRAAR